MTQRVYRYRNYWGKKGGITVSGGEPLRQMDFLTEFFMLARAKGVHTALDTAGQPFRPDDPAYLAAFDRLMANTSLCLSGVSGFPIYSIFPETDVFSGKGPSTECARRLFPEPLAPTTARISPGYTSASRDRITCRSHLFHPLSYRLKETVKSVTFKRGVSLFFIFCLLFIAASRVEKHFELVSYNIK